MKQHIIFDLKHYFILAEFFDAYNELTPMHVCCTLNFSSSKITSLGNLERIDGTLIIKRTNITSLGKLKNVSGWLDIRHTKITSLGNLESVGDSIYCDDKQYEKLCIENNGRFGIINLP